MQQQEHAKFDLLAVFNDESKADAAEAGLNKAGFGEDEVFRLAAGSVVDGKFREHGPNRNRSAFFLQTKRSGPNISTVILWAVFLGVLLGVVLFLAHFAFGALPEPLTALAGAGVGIVLGAILGALRSRRVRGAIGQDMSKVNIAVKRPAQEERTVLALRFSDADDIARQSRARAILLRNEGKIDKSVGE
jgi:hypothetical protein